MFTNIHDFTNLIDRIDDCVTLYERKRMENTRFKLYLSNGEEISISYDLNSLPHLLGINTNFLRSTNIYEGSSWNILVDILDNPNKLYNQIKNGHIKPENVFSKQIEEKLENFENICGINISKIEFVSEYDKQNHHTSIDNQLEGEYYIGFRPKADTLSVVGFANNNGLYFPMTNLKFHYYRDEKENFLKRLLTNQVLLSVQTLRKNTYVNDDIDRKKFFYSHEEKEKKV